MYNDKMWCIIWRVLSHYKEGTSHHFQNFSRNLNVDVWNLCHKMVSSKSPSLARCKEGDLPLLNSSNLTCMYYIHVSFCKTLNLLTIWTCVRRGYLIPAALIMRAKNEPPRGCWVSPYISTLKQLFVDWPTSIKSWMIYLPIAVNSLHEKLFNAQALRACLPHWWFL